MSITLKPADDSEVALPAALATSNLTLAEIGALFVMASMSWPGHHESEESQSRFSNRLKGEEMVRNTARLVASGVFGQRQTGENEITITINADKALELPPVEGSGEQMPPPFEIELMGQLWKLRFDIQGYQDGGGICVSLICDDGEEFCVLSVNLDEALGAGLFFLKNYSENIEVANSLIREGYVELTGEFSKDTLRLPVAKLTDKALAHAITIKNP